MVSIIVPTYNERENLTPLLERIESTLGSSEDYEVIVVDDDSPDKTWEKARELSGDYPIKVVRRKKERGLGTAVVCGLKESNHDVVVVMDADLQHPPEKIPELVSEIKEGKDIAIGSRFVKGGDKGDFGFFRSIMSRGADFLARTLFRKTRGVKDIQSGFFALRKEIVKGADLDPIGYKILLEILVQTDYDEVSEVGYKFGQRKSGESKLGLGSILNYLRHIWSLSGRSGELARFIKFCSVGGSGALVNLIVIYLLTSSGLYYLLSGIIAREAALIYNFSLNKLWTFRDRDISGAKEILRALFRDHLVRTGGFALNLFFLWSLTEFLGLYYLISQVIAIGIASLWNFTGNTLWTWRSEGD
ncbi:hypothetical protein AKJ64_02350 [candidate division MSBL1 archaeon SCGC-AAA259E17]|uniref:Dolichol-phosphate mannosyltransferase n=1 Tax=candidate division MSBL1 archaeon SCGC-AAA259E17 TaxID=1698263 RepID=A0A133UES9_9EURY|nr:hypothetical protein AKJ64_02350 [candidate division MSBL1 archaeon SCGC-AAA259E17]